MTTQSTILAPLLLVAAALGCGALGCEGQTPAARSPSEEAGSRQLGREAAVQSARQDAWLRYREIPVSEVGAQLLGGFWIVELRAPNGSGLRYAISTEDGTIKQRNLFQ
jgi:hypothetical protein